VQAGENTGPLRIVIVGGGTAGWMCAAGLARLLVPDDYDLTLIESEEIGTVGVGEATLPHIRRFNAMLGLDEAAFLRATQGSIKLGVEFVDWLRPGERYIHPFGTFGEPWAGVEFQHHWTRARQAGEPVGSFQDYSYAIAACRRNAFEPPQDDPASIRGTYDYAYHFDAGLYADYLRRWATARGVERIEGKVVDIRRDPANGHVHRLTLASGAEVEGDLFVDCSGFRSLLVGATMGSGWHDWSEWLPCDRALAVPCARVDPLTPYTRLTAQRGGWVWRIPLQHRTGNGHVFSSRHCSEDEACDILLSRLDGEALGEPRLLRFQAGRRDRAWVGNCVAIGLSSGFLEPLESTSIYLIQAAIIDLANLIPARGGGIDPRLAAEFNRLFAALYERTRDFLILHYAANDRVGEPLWDEARAMTLPDDLRQRIDLFRASGTMPEYRLGLFSRDSWLAVLIGQGVAPGTYNRLADHVPIAELRRRLVDLHARIAAGVADMPDQAAFLARPGADDAGAGAAMRRVATA